MYGPLDEEKKMIVPFVRIVTMRICLYICVFVYRYFMNNVVDAFVSHSSFSLNSSRYFNWTYDSTSIASMLITVPSDKYSFALDAAIYKLLSWRRSYTNLFFSFTSDLNYFGLDGWSGIALEPNLKLDWNVCMFMRMWDGGEMESYKYILFTIRSAVFIIGVCRKRPLLTNSSMFFFFIILKRSKLRI